MNLSAGGMIGFYCAHLYAHTANNTERLMPYALKGIDMAIYSALSSLGLVTKACPIMGDRVYEEVYDRNDGNSQKNTIAGKEFTGTVRSNFCGSYETSIRSVGTHWTTSVTKLVLTVIYRRPFRMSGHT